MNSNKFRFLSLLNISFFNKTQKHIKNKKLFQELLLEVK